MNIKLKLFKIDHSITFIMIVFVIILFSSVQFFSQEEIKNSNMTDIGTPNSTEAVNDKIEFKNESGNAIMTITDEGGNSSSISLPKVNSQMSGDKLYNYGGELYWGKNPINTAAQDNDWQISDTNMYTLPSGNVGIGVTNPTSKLEVDGNIRTQGFEMNIGVSNGYLLTSDSIGNGTWQAPNIAGFVPIGSIISWAKNLTGVPSLQNNFVECNGQTLIDTDSPLNNQVIPNLNGYGGNAKRFLRGGTASGNIGGSDSHTHSGFTNSSTAYTQIHSVSEGPYSIDYAAQTGHSHQYTTNQTIALPSYYEVVFIMRVK